MTETKTLTSKKRLTTTGGETNIEFSTVSLREKKYILVINNIYYVDAATTAPILYLKLNFTPTNLIDTQNIMFLEFNSSAGVNYYSGNNPANIGVFEALDLNKFNKIEIYNGSTNAKLAVNGTLFIDYSLY